MKKRTGLRLKIHNLFWDDTTWLGHPDSNPRLWSWIVAGLLGLLVLFAGIGHLSWRLDRQSCRTYSEQSGYETKYIDTALWSWQCFVNVDGRWILQDQIRVIEKDL